MFWNKKTSHENKKIDAEVEKLIAETELPTPPVPSKKIIEARDELVPTSMPITVEEGSAKIAEKQRGLSWKQKMKLSRSPTKTYLVTMFYGNGSCEHFVVETTSHFFSHGKNKKYHINKTLCQWDANENTYHLYYHEDQAEPLEFKQIHVNETTDTMMASVTPENLDSVIKMEFVRLIAEGPELGKMMRIMLFLGIATLGLLLIITIIFIVQSGALQAITQNIQPH
jgi:hypothetical protein